MQSRRGEQIPLKSVVDKRRNELTKKEEGEKKKRDKGEERRGEREFRAGLWQKKTSDANKENFYEERVRCWNREVRGKKI